VLNRDHCIHYNGVHRDACAAGVGYATIARDQTPGEQERARAAGAINFARFGLLHRLPCIRGNGVEITGVRVERVGEMSADDVTNEGCESLVTFAKMWNHLNLARGFPWQSNPWTWVLEFRRVL
jgi:hypothetical protein